MAILRRDDFLTTPQGQALAGALVYYLTQPADVATLTPLATVYSDTTGMSAANPQTTDGYGHVAAYLQDGQLYTVVFTHPLLAGPLVYPDQSLNGAAAGGVTPFGQVPAGTIDGNNTVFTLTVSPATLLLIVVNIGLLVVGEGFTTAIVDGVFTITMAVAPQPAADGQPGDFFYAFGIL